MARYKPQHMKEFKLITLPGRYSPQRLMPRRPWRMATKLERTLSMALAVLMLIGLLPMQLIAAALEPEPVYDCVHICGEDPCAYTEEIPCDHVCAEACLVLPSGDEGYTSGQLPDAVRFQSLIQGQGLENAVLPEALSGQPVTWTCEPAFDPAVQGLYVLTADDAARTVLSIAVVPNPRLRALGVGTEADPLQITTAAQLAELAVLVNTSGGKFGTIAAINLNVKLMSDLDLGSYNWTPIGKSTRQFAGSFDGNGHVIRNLTINRSEAQQGLFGYVAGSVQKLGLVDVSVSGGSNTGGVTGYTTGTVQHCYVTGSVSGGVYTGGVVGYCNGTVQYCYSTASVSSTSKAGGVLGANIKEATHNVALGASVTSDVATDVNRIIGAIGSAVTHSDNYAYSGMPVGKTGSEAIITGSTAGSPHGLDVTPAGLTPAFWEGLGFTATSGWTLPADTTGLPGFGAALPLPEHLTATDDPFAGGDGTSADTAYQIETPEQLALLATEVNAGNTDYNAAYYVLTADLDLSGYAEGEGWTPIGDSSNQFTGHFNGNGHVISNLTITRSSESYQGLFGYVGSGGVVEKLGLESINVTASQYAGGVAGRNAGTVQNCYVTGAVTGTSTRNGGVIGEVDASGKIQYCYATAGVHADYNSGGILGYLNGGSCNNNVALGDTVTSGTSEQRGRVIGLGSGADNHAYSGMKIGYVNSKAAISSTDATSNNGADCAAIPDVDFWVSTVQWDPYIWRFEEGAYPVFGTTSGFAGGDGLAANTAYQIATPAQLAFLAEQVNAGNTGYNAAYYILTADLDLSGYKDNGGWTPIGKTSKEFSGNFNGNGHVISNLTISRTSTYQGLFGCVTNSGVVEKLGLEDVSISGSDYVGAVVGRAFGLVQHCYVTGSVSGTSEVGGVVGYCATLQYCYSTASVSGIDAYVGGISGERTTGTFTANVALGATVTSGKATIGRVIGLGSGTNNHAYNGMTVNDSAIAAEDTGADTVHGTDLTPAQALTAAFWKDTVGFTTANLWIIEDGYFPYFSAACKHSGPLSWGGTHTVPSAPQSLATSDLTGTGVTLTWAAPAESGLSAITGYEVSSDGTGWTAISGTDTLTYSFTGLDYATPYTLYVRAVSSKGKGEAATKAVTTSPAFATGTGAQATPYEISTVAELQTLATLVNAGNGAYNSKYYILTADLDLSSVCSSEKGSWTPIGTSANPFKGKFNGNGHVIKGLYINTTSGDQGLFGVISAATVENLGLVSVNIKGSKAGGIAGSYSNSTIKNCFVSGTVSGSSSVGGIVGYPSSLGSITNCVALTTTVATSGSGVGRISGATAGTRTNNYAYREMALSNSGGTYTPTSAKDGADGADIFAANARSASWWTAAAADSGPGWSTDVWTFEDGCYPRSKTTATGTAIPLKDTPVLTAEAYTMVFTGSAVSIANITRSATVNSVAVPGSWSTTSQIIDVSQSRTITLTFTPTNTDLYNSATIDVSVTITKADPTYTTPIELTAALGDTLGSITLPTAVTSGTFTWEQSSNTVLNTAGTITAYTLKFTPGATGNYNTITGIPVSITVSKPTLGGSVSITGTAQYGETLTAVTTDLATTPSGKTLGTLSYQWTRGGTAISGATASTYVLTADDIGQSITVAVAAADCDGSVAATAVTGAKRPLTAAQGSYAVTKVYDGTTSAGTGSGAFDITGLVGTDTVSITATPGAYPSAAVGSSHSVTAGLALTSDLYSLTTGSLSITDAAITQKALTVAAGTYTVYKVYDGTTDAGTGSGTLSISGIVSGDDVTVAATPGAFPSAAAGSSTVAVALALSGSASGNYSVASSINVPGNLAYATQTVSFTSSSVTKAYGDAAFTITATNSKSDGGAITYSSSNTSVATVNSSSGEVTLVGVGSATISATAALVSGKYAASESASYALTVGQKALTDAMVASIAAQAYTGSQITPTPAVTDGSALTSGTHFDYSYGTNITVADGGSVTITGKGNYTGTVTKSFTISKASSGFSATTPANRLILTSNTSANSLALATALAPTAASPGSTGTISYALGSFSDTSGVLSGAPTLADGTLSYTGNGKTTGTATQVIVVSCANYADINVTLTFEATDKTITTVTATAPAGITYGGTLGNPSATAAAGGSTFTYSYSGTLADGSATPYGPSADKPTKPGSYTVEASLDSSTHKGSGTANFTISTKALTWVSGAVSGKAYDGTTAATVATAPTLSGVLSGDTVEVSAGTAAFASAGAGTKAVTGSGWGIGGTHAAFYTISGQPAFSSATIGKANAPAITWPTAASITYGAALSTAALSGGSDHGTFAWTAGSTVPTVANDGYSVTYTPSAATLVNYNAVTVTNMVSITVARANQDPPAAITSSRSTSDGGTTWTVSIESPLSGAVYSIDQSDWSKTSWTGQSGQITLYAKYSATANHNESAATSQSVNLAKQDQTAPGSFSLTYTATGETGYTVTIPAVTGGEYSFDGQAWGSTRTTSADPGNTVTGYVRLAGTETLNPSSATSAALTLPLFTVKSPTATPNGGSFSGSLSVTLASATADADIYYTLDGSDPDADSTPYDGAFTLGTTTTVKAIAIKDGMNNSAVLTVTFSAQTQSPQTLDEEPAPEPAQSPDLLVTAIGGEAAVDIPAVLNTDTGAVTVTLDDQTTRALIETAQSAAPAGQTPIVTLDLSQAEAAKSVALTVAVAEALRTAEVELTVSLPAADITLTGEGLRQLTRAGAGVDAIVVDAHMVPRHELGGQQVRQLRGTEQVIDINVFVGGQKTNTEMTVTMLYTLGKNEKPEGIAVWNLLEDGSLERMECVYDAATQSVSFKLSHQSFYVLDYDVVGSWVNIFTDLTKDSELYDSIAYANHYGLFYGYGNGLFGIHDKMTRAMLVQVLWAMEDCPAPSSAAAFTDVPANAWYERAVAWGYENGIVVGVGGGMFMPDRNVSTQELAVMLYNYAIYKGIPLPVDTAIPPFTEQDCIDVWAETAAKALMESGILARREREGFDAKQEVERGDAAQMIVSLRQLLDRISE